MILKILVLQGHDFHKTCIPISFSEFLLFNLFFTELKNSFCFKRYDRLNFGISIDFGGQINFYEKMDFFQFFFNLKYKLNNQNSLKLIRLQVLGKF